MKKGFKTEILSAGRVWRILTEPKATEYHYCVYQESLRTPQKEKIQR